MRGSLQEALTGLGDQPHLGEGGKHGLLFPGRIVTKVRPHAKPDKLMGSQRGESYKLKGLKQPQRMV